MILAVGFVLGEVLGLQNKVGILVCFWTAGSVLILWNDWKKILRTGRSLWLWLLPVFVLAGVIRAGTVKNAFDKEQGLDLDGKTVTAVGRVTAIEKRKDGMRVLQVKDCVLDEGGTEIQRLQVYLPKEQSEQPLSLGNQVRIGGTISSMQAAHNPGEFDYRLYYRSLGITYGMFGENCQLLDDERYIYREVIRRAGVWASEMLERTAKEEAGVYQAVLLGDQKGMNEELRNLYQKNGIAHLLAVSGLHLSMVSMAVYGTLRKLGMGYGKAGIAGGAVLFSYGILTGSSPSVIRALIMGLCGFLAAYLGRTYDLLSALSLAAFWIFWENPYQICQAGVQLSFGAVLGIGWLSPKLLSLIPEKKTETSRFLCGVQGVLVSLSIQIVTVPIVLYHFFQYPVYGIILNFLVIPLMGVLVASGSAGILFGSIHQTLGHFVMGSGHYILVWYEVCCGIFERFPFAVWISGRPEIWEIGCYYGAVCWLVLGMEELREKGRIKRNRMLLVLFMGGLLFMPPIQSHGLTATFLDVGQGDGICIRSGKEVILVDGGSSDEKNLGKNRLVPFLKSQGIQRISCVVVSHGDMDHISGLLYLFEQEPDIEIETLMLPAAAMNPEAGSGYEKLMSLALKRGIFVKWMEAGDRMTFGEAEMTCLYPAGEIKEQKELDMNEHSLVLQITCGWFQMLLTGDMSKNGEQEILKKFPPESLSNIQVLKVAHHGSDSSTGEEWLKAVSPRWAVISCGKGNRYGHPHKEVMDRLLRQNVQILQTEKEGAITLRTDGKRIWWSTFTCNRKKGMLY